MVVPQAIGAIVKNIDNIPAETSRIKSTGEALSLQALLGRFRGFTVYHQILEPGHRSASPHAHTSKDEFVLVLEGNPDALLDGYLHRLKPGDVLSLTAGTGTAHTLINNSQTIARYLVVSSADAIDDEVFYAHRNPVANEPELFSEWRQRGLGPHAALPERRPYE